MPPVGGVHSIALKNFRFPFPLHDATLQSKQQPRAVFGGRRWKDSELFFKGLTPPPRKSNATNHDLIEMLVIALLAALSGKSSCSSFARYARVKYEFLKGFLELKGGSPSHDSFSDLSDALDPEQMVAALTENAEPNAERAGVPRRHPAHRPEHRVPHGRRALARGKDGHRWLERQIFDRLVRERGRQILKAEELGYLVKRFKELMGFLADTIYSNDNIGASTPTVAPAST